MYHTKENNTIAISKTRLLVYENTIPYIWGFFFSHHFYCCKHVAYYYILFYYYQAVHNKLGSWFTHAQSATSISL